MFGNFCREQCGLKSDKIWLCVLVCILSYSGDHGRDLQRQPLSSNSGVEAEGQESPGGEISPEARSEVAAPPSGSHHKATTQAGRTTDLWAEHARFELNPAF